MDLELKNKRFLVTGSSRGIGKSIVYRLLKEGAKVAIVSRGKKNLEATVKEFSSKFSAQNILSFSSDCTSNKDLTDLKKDIVDIWHGIDGLIANVGDGRSVNDPIPKVEQWNSTWNTNFYSSYLAASIFLDLLKESKGCLSFISSIVGVESVGAPIDYSTAKSALNAFAKNLSRKIAPDIRVNVIAPGNIFFKGGSWDQKLLNDNKMIDKMIKENVPMQRFGKPEEVADIAAILCSNRSSFVTGSIIRVDGGQTTSF